MHKALRGALCSLLMFTAASGVLPTGSAPSARAQTAPRPNILIILTDDQRANGTYDVMPKTMRLFRDGGTGFPNGFVTTPLCCPSRASIFSGQYAHNHGVIDTRSVYAFDKTHSMQYWLQKAGYSTGVVGKYRVSGPVRYFDRWATMWPLRSYGHSLFNLHGRLRVIHEYSTDFLLRKANEFIDGFAAKDRPWFLVVAPFAPHSPATPAIRDRKVPVGPWEANPANQETDLSDKPSAVRRKADHVAPLSQAKRMRRKQLRSLMAVDDMVSGIFSKLDETGESNQTLAFYLSDNGYQWYEHSLRKKGWPYEDSVRVPFFIRWPGFVPAGNTDERLVANIDIAPTVYELAGVSPNYTVDGWSLFGPHDRDRLLLEYWASRAGRSWKALWTDSYEYVEYDNSEREFYDLILDPWQLENRLKDSDGSDPATFPIYKQLRADEGCYGSSCP